MLNFKILSSTKWKQMEKEEKLIGRVIRFNINKNVYEVTITKLTSYGPEGEDSRAYTGNKAEGQKQDPGTVDMHNMMGNWVMLIATGSPETAACVKIDEVSFEGKKMRTGAFFKQIVQLDKSGAAELKGSNVLKSAGPVRLK